MTQLTKKATTILYIDDDEDDLLIFGESINTLYPDVLLLKAQSGEEGLEVLKKCEQANEPLPCLIVLDLNMPRMDGRQTLKAIRDNDRWKNIPVVIFTTSSNIVDITFCKSNGTECITKPMSYATLGGTVKRIVQFSNVALE